MIFTLRRGIFAVSLDDYVIVLSRYTHFGSFRGVLGTVRGTPDPSLAAVSLVVASARFWGRIQFLFFISEKKK